MTDHSTAHALSEAQAHSLHLKLLLHALRHLTHGSLHLSLPDGSSHTYTGAQPGVHADLHIAHAGLAHRVLRTADIGLGEAYRDGWFTTHDLTKLLLFATENARSFEQIFFGQGLAHALRRLLHVLRFNSRGGSRKNIAAHYDLSNAFYAHWLDDSMTYSSALFADPSASLACAQQHKYASIAHALDLRAQHALLEIGCGWGGFAEHALQLGVRQLRAITISRAQLEYARRRLARDIEAGRADLAFEDYRDTRGSYDRIVSIEMFEAVGQRYWPDYFQALKRLLRADGAALVQTIVIADDVFEGYRKRTDFIQQYIFPGGMLPSRARFISQARRAGLIAEPVCAFGPSYAETLKRWRERFDAARDAIGALGFDPAFQRLWRFYFCFCEAGFLSGRTDVVQFKLRHADSR